MNALSVSRLGETRQYAQGWAFSLLVHALGISAAIALVADLRLAPQPEPFRWDVSVVETPTPQQPDKPTPSQAKPTPASPKPVERQPVDPQPVTQTVQTVQTVQQVVRQQIVREVRPVVQATSQQTVPVETQSVVSPEPYPVETEQASPVVSEAPVTSASPAATPGTPSVVSRPVVEAIPSPAVVQERTVVRDSAQAAVKELPIRSAPATKADYSWLAEALWNRVEQLKRYPHIARMNRWEGKVVLRAVIREDGRLMNLEVAESSGHSVLDRDAMEIMKQASPLKLKHPLGQPQVVVQVPINYKLQ
ncbi:MAG: TonB family protein [Nitrospiraceae bacterium]